MKTLTECINAAKTQGQDYNYNNLNKQAYNYNKPVQTIIKPAPKLVSGAKLYQLINTDPTLKLGLEWGMAGGLLYNLCQEYGVQTVKRSIDYVARLPEPKRNGRYCRTVILNGGPKG